MDSFDPSFRATPSSSPRGIRRQEGAEPPLPPRQKSLNIPQTNLETREVEVPGPANPQTNQHVKDLIGTIYDQGASNIKDRDGFPEMANTIILLGNFLKNKSLGQLDPEVLMALNKLVYGLLQNEAYTQGGERGKLWAVHVDAIWLAHEMRKKDMLYQTDTWLTIQTERDILHIASTRQDATTNTLLRNNYDSIRKLWQPRIFIIPESARIQFNAISDENHSLQESVRQQEEQLRQLQQQNEIQKKQISSQEQMYRQDFASFRENIDQQNNARTQEQIAELNQNFGNEKRGLENQVNTLSQQIQNLKQSLEKQKAIDKENLDKVSHEKEELNNENQLLNQQLEKFKNDQIALNQQQNEEFKKVTAELIQQQNETNQKNNLENQKLQKELQNQNNQLVEQLKTQESEQSIRNIDLQNKLTQLQEQNEKLQTEFKEKQEKSAQLQDKKFTEIENKNEELINANQKLQEEVETLKQNQGQAQTTNQELQHNIRAKTSENVQLQQQLKDQAIKQQETTESFNQKLEAQKANYEKGNKNLQEQLGRIQNQNAQLQKQLSEVEKKFKEEEQKFETNAESSKQKFEQQSQENENLKKQNQQLSQESDTQTSAIKDQQKEIEQLKENFARIEKEKQEILQKSQQVESTQSELIQQKEGKIKDYKTQAIALINKTISEWQTTLNSNASLKEKPNLKNPDLLSQKIVLLNTYLNEIENIQIPKGNLIKIENTLKEVEALGSKIKSQIKDGNKINEQLNIIYKQQSEIQKQLVAMHEFIIDAEEKLKLNKQLISKSNNDQKILKNSIDQAKAWINKLDNLKQEALDIDSYFKKFGEINKEATGILDSGNSSKAKIVSSNENISNLIKRRKDEFSSIQKNIEQILSNLARINQNNELQQMIDKSYWDRAQKISELFQNQNETINKIQTYEEHGTLLNILEQAQQNLNNVKSLEQEINEKIAENQKSQQEKTKSVEQASRHELAIEEIKTKFTETQKLITLKLQDLSIKANDPIVQKIIPPGADYWNEAKAINDIFIQQANNFQNLQTLQDFDILLQEAQKNLSNLEKLTSNIDQAIAQAKQSAAVQLDLDKQIKDFNDTHKILVKPLQESIQKLLVEGRQLYELQNKKSEIFDPVENKHNEIEAQIKKILENLNLALAEKNQQKIKDLKSEFRSIYDSLTSNEGYLKKLIQDDIYNINANGHKILDGIATKYYADGPNYFEFTPQFMSSIRNAHTPIINRLSNYLDSVLKENMPNTILDHISATKIPESKHKIDEIYDNIKILIDQLTLVNKLEKDSSKKVQLEKKLSTYYAQIEDAKKKAHDSLYAHANIKFKEIFAKFIKEHTKNTQNVLQGLNVPETNEYALSDQDIYQFVNFFGLQNAVKTKADLDQFVMFMHSKKCINYLNNIKRGKNVFKQEEFDDMFQTFKKQQLKYSDWLTSASGL